MKGGGAGGRYRVEVLPDDTDLANPTSNAIYRRVGYEPLMDVRDFEIRATKGEA